MAVVRFMLLLVVAVSVADVGVAAATQPLLVLPFKKITEGRRYGIARLEYAIARTMAIDLRASKGLEVVPWESVKPHFDSRAFYKSEKAIAGEHAIELARKAGARSVIVGSYRLEGMQLLLDAELLDVGSGKRVAKANADGHRERIFLTQDRILSGLLGNSYVVPDRSMMPSQKEAEAGSKDLFSAYGLYALASGSNNAGRYRKMESALDKEPGFSYALNEMRAIKKNTSDRYRVLLRKRQPELDRSLRRELAAENAKARVAAFEDLCEMLELTGYYRDLILVADRVLALRWTDDEERRLQDSAWYRKIEAVEALKQPEQVLELGRVYIKQFPRGRSRNRVERLMARVERGLEKREKARQDLTERLRSLETRRARVEFSRCQLIFSHAQFLRAAQECRDFIQRFSDNAGRIDLLRKARWLRIQAHFEAGDFARARELAKSVQERDPEFAESISLRTILRTWPAD